VEGTPCDLSSTISTGSFWTSEPLEASPVDTGLSSDGTEDQILRETASCPWKSSQPLTLKRRQENLSTVSETQLPKGERYLYKGSQIQQILRKRTGDLNSYLEDNTHFQAAAPEHSFPETERDFSNFCHQLFQPLEPSLDLDTSSSSSQDSGELSKTSKFSTKSQDVPTFLEVGNSSLNRQRRNLPPGLETDGANSSAAESAHGSVT
ncbi:CE295 protein, partial [Jacana jacana]|nr:CE295 protein [Jacana jacana]